VLWQLGRQGVHRGVERGMCQGAAVKTVILSSVCTPLLVIVGTCAPVPEHKRAYGICYACQHMLALVMRWRRVAGDNKQRACISIDLC